MKKVLAVLLALAMVFSFAACGEKKEEGKKEAEAFKKQWEQEKPFLWLSVFFTSFFWQTNIRKINVFVIML